MAKKDNGILSYRDNTMMLPKYGLPFQVESIGVEQVKKGHIVKQPALDGGCIHLHWHISGISKMFCGGLELRSTKDDISFRYPGENLVKHALSEEYQSRWLALAGPLACAIVMSYGFPRIMPARVPYPAELFDEIEELCSKKSLFAQRRACALVLEVLALADGRFEEGAPHEQIVDNAREYIRTNLADPALCVGELAERFQVSRTQLNNLFRARGLHSPGRLILDLRLARARELIYGTDMSVSEISRACGFASPHTFSKFIKRATGSSALNLRKKEGD